MWSGSGTRECITLSMQTGASTCNKNKNAWECIHNHRIMYLTCICSVQSANQVNLQIGQANLPIGRLVVRFANCAAQSANYPGICLICKLSQLISIHNMKVSNVVRQRSEILTIVMSVNIFHGRQLPVMLVSCHNLCRISSFNTKMNKMKQVLQLLLLVSRKSDHQTTKDKTK